MKVDVAALSATTFVLSGIQAFPQAQRALLIGIDACQPARTKAQHPAGCIHSRCELGIFKSQHFRGRDQASFLCWQHSQPIRLSMPEYF
jgi:hypothetical protein